MSQPANILRFIESLLYTFYKPYFTVIVYGFKSQFDFKRS